MSKEYIERRAISEKIDALEVPVFYADGNLEWFQDGFRDALKQIEEILEEQPTTDVQEVRHGEWIDNAEDVYFGSSFARKHCSECGDEPEYREGKNSYVLSNYCRNCGAKMDKSE